MVPQCSNFGDVVFIQFLSSTEVHPDCDDYLVPQILTTLLDMHRHLSGKIFVRTPTAVYRTSSSGMQTDTKPVVELTVFFRATQKMEDPTRLPRTTRVTRNLLRKPTKRTTKSLLTWRPTIPTRKHLFLSLLLLRSLPLRHSCFDTEFVANANLQWNSKEALKPRIELPEEDELFVSSQLQSFRKQVQKRVNDHGVEGIGTITVCSIASNCTNSEAISRDDSHLHRVSDEQGVELAFDMSWNRCGKFE